MTPEDHEARTRLVVQATRQALQQQLARARGTLMIGAISFAIGAAVIVASGFFLKSLGGVPISLVAIGVTICLFAVVRMVRGLAGQAVVRRRLRGLDEQRLPAARIVKH